MTATIAIVGAGPAGLMAAELLAARGHAVTIYDRMTSPARKFLMAGRGGLNITHSEPLDRFLSRYGELAPALRSALLAFPPDAMGQWLTGLGIETFVGSSGRVFPRTMKASPLLRAWLRRLEASRVHIKTNHDWQGFTPVGCLAFSTPDGTISVAPDATILALGGASWPRLGSNGAWATMLARDGITITALTASNCGVLIPWSQHIITRFAGTPLKRIALSIGGTTTRGEAVITRTGLEGGAVYALSFAIRSALQAQGNQASPMLHRSVLAAVEQGLEAKSAIAEPALLSLDLRPDMTLSDITERLAVPRGKQSTASILRKALNLSPAASALLREAGPLPTNPADLAARIKALLLPITATAGLDRAISTAGGISFDAIDENFMLRTRPGVFVAGEMLDWDAPTGGYLLQATIATAAAAAYGAERWLGSQPLGGR